MSASPSKIRRAFTYAPLRAMLVRGTEGEVAAAEWLLRKLDRLYYGAVHSPVENDIFRMPDVEDNVIRVFFLTNTPDAMRHIEASTMLRSLGQIRRCFTYVAPKAIAMRGTPEQVALAEWLIPRIEGKANAEGNYRIGSDDDFVRLFPAPGTAAPEAARDLVGRLRAHHMRNAFVYGYGNFLGVRGTAAQLQTAEEVVNQWAER